MIGNALRTPLGMSHPVNEDESTRDQAHHHAERDKLEKLARCDQRQRPEERTESVITQNNIALAEP